jgi:hypothetical protein
MEINTTLKPMDLYPILTQASKYYNGTEEDTEINKLLYSEYIQELGLISKKILEWEMDIRNLIEFEIAPATQFINQFDSINISLNNFQQYLSIGMFSLVEYVKNIQDKKPEVAKSFSESIVKCFSLSKDLEQFEPNENFILLLKLSDSDDFFEYDEFDY